MRKPLRILGLVLVTYLIQTTILPRFNALTIQPDLMLAVLVWLTAGGDRYTGFCVGAIMGLVMDATVGTLPLLYLLAYPIMGYASARLTPLLVDKLPRPKKTNKLLTLKRFYLIVPPLTAAIMALLYELALMVYRYLNGVDVTLASMGRIVRFVLYTAIATVFAQFLVRLMLTPRKSRTSKGNATQA